MTIRSLFVLLLLRSLSSHLFKKSSSILHRFGLLKSPAELLSTPEKTSSYHIFKQPKMSKYLNPHDYSLSLRQKTTIINAITNNNTAQALLLSNFYFQPVTEHLEHLISDYNSLRTLLSAEKIAPEHKKAIVNFYYQHPKKLETLLPSNFELADFLSLVSLTQAQKNKLINKLFNIEKDTILIDFLSKSLTIDIKKSDGSIPTIEEHASLSEMFYSRNEVRALQYLAACYLFDAEKVLKKISTVGQVADLISNVFVDSDLRKKFTVRITESSWGLADKISSLIDLQALRRFHTLVSDEQLLSLLTQSRFESHPLTLFFRVCQLDKIETLTHQALYGADNALDAIYLKEGFSFLLQHTKSLDDFCCLLQNPALSVTTKESLKQNFLEMSSEMFEYLIKTSAELCDAPVLLDLNLTQTRQLWSLYTQNNGALLCGLQFDFHDIEKIMTLYGLGSHDKQLLLESYVTALVKKGHSFVSIYADFEREYYFFILFDESRTLSSKINHFYWQAPLDRLLPVLSFYEELVFLKSLLAGTDYEPNVEALIKQLISHPEKYLLPLVLSLDDMICFIDSFIEPQTLPLFLERVLIGLKISHSTKLFQNMADLEVFIRSFQLQPVHHILLWELLKHNSYQLLHELCQSYKDLLWVIKKLNISGQDKAALIRFYESDSLGLQSLSALGFSLLDTYQFSKALCLDNDITNTLCQLKTLEHLEFMQFFAGSLEDFKERFLHFNDQQRHAVTQMIILNKGAYFSMIVKTTSDKTELLGLPWPTELGGSIKIIIEKAQYPLLTSTLFFSGNNTSRNPDFNGSNPPFNSSKLLLL
jgi:hypothetical protein